MGGPIPTNAPPQGFGEPDTFAATAILKGGGTRATINDAIAALPAAGGTIYCEGTFNGWTSAISTPGKPIKIVGMKENFIVDLESNANAAFEIAGDEPFHIEGCSFRGDASAGQIAVKDANVGSRVPRSAIVMMDCEVGRGADPLRTVFDSGTAGTYAFLVRIGHVGSGAGSDAISGTGAGEIFVLDCDLEGDFVAGGATPVQYHIMGLKMTNLGTAMEIGADSFLDNMEVDAEIRLRDRCKISNTRNADKIVLKGDDIQIVNCRLTDQGAGVGAIEDDGTVRARITMVGNIISGTTGDGFRGEMTDSRVAGNVNFRVTEQGASDNNEYHDIFPGSTIIGADSVVVDWNTRTVTTTPVTLDQDDRTVLVDSSGGNRTVNLPAAGAARYQVYTIKKIAAANTVTIDPSGAELIEGATTLGLVNDDDSVVIQSDGTAWFVLARKLGQGAQVFTGTYTGDGTTSMAVTGIGFAPKYVRIWERTTVSGEEVSVWETSDTIVDDNAAGGAILINDVAFMTNAIISLDSDGFTVDDAGADEHPNQNGAVYNFMCVG